MMMLEATDRPLPYYTVNGEKVRMPLADEAQALAVSDLETMEANLSRVFGAFRLLRENETVLQGLPLDYRKAPEFVGMGVPTPDNFVIRVDAVAGKIVDINNKPSGLGLTLASYQTWLYRGVFGQRTPMLPRVEAILPPGDFRSAAILTSRNYPFSSDQKRLAEVMRDTVPEIDWRVCYPELVPPDEDEEEAIFSFSYLSGDDSTLRDWRRYLGQNPERFLENPAAAVFWDNKALMALPFLNLELDNPLRESLEGLREVFPETYLVRTDDKRLMIATALSADGLRFEELGRENTPIMGMSYLKPLGESGGRFVATKALNDWGGSVAGIQKYSERFPEGFVVQRWAEPDRIDGLQIKDGYFANTSGEQALVIALERMGTAENTPKIHGGSKTKLIPVFLEGEVVI